MGNERVQLKRQVGVLGAVGMGLGSIVGTGVFVSLGMAAGIAGPAVTLALGLAALLAAFNGLSSAQLAATHPVSGGTYEYANRTIGPLSGFTAGWMFLTAKSASAATAALGFAGYLRHLLGMDGSLEVPVALGTIGALTLLVYAGIRTSNAVNAVVVAITLAGLGLLIGAGLPVALGQGRPNLVPFVPSVLELPDLLEATALMFVAYTGYGRIATLGEEVVDPRRTIPRAIATALAVVLLLYVGVGVTALGVLGSDAYARATVETAAPLEAVARALGHGWLATTVAVVACTAMLGVMLNLVLGLSRVLLAMGRRGDAPVALARIDASGTTPGPAVLATGAGIALLALVGSVRATWSFSAFTVLVYYGFTNLAALRLAPEQRLYPGWTSWAGLLGCGFLAFQVEPVYWAAGLGLLVVGHLGRRVVRELAPAG